MGIHNHLKNGVKNAPLLNSSATTARGCEVSHAIIMEATSASGGEPLSQLGKAGQGTVNFVPSVRKACSQFLLFILLQADMGSRSKGIILLSDSPGAQ